MSPLAKMLLLMLARADLAVSCSLCVRGGGPGGLIRLLRRLRYIDVVSWYRRLPPCVSLCVRFALRLVLRHHCLQPRHVPL